MPKQINKVPQSMLSNTNDVKWFSSIKDKINKLDNGYGSIDVELKIKGGEVVAIRYTSKSNENIG